MVLLQDIQVSLILGKPELNVTPHQYLSSLNLLAAIFLTQLRVLQGYVGGSWPVCIPPDPPFHFMLSSCLALYLHRGMGLFFPRSRILHFPFVELQEVTVSPFLHHAQASPSATDASAATSDFILSAK